MRLNTFFLATSLCMASLASAADNMLFTPVTQSRSSEQTLDREGMTWGPMFKSVQAISFNADVLFNRSYVRPATSSREANFQAVMNSAPEVYFPVDGLLHHAVQLRFDFRSSGNFTWYGEIVGSQWRTIFGVLKDVPFGDIWTPGVGHRVILTRGGKTYLVEYDEQEIGKSLVNDQILDASSHEVPHERESLGARVSGGGIVRPAVGKPVFKRNPCGSGEVLVEQATSLEVYEKKALEWFLKPPYEPSNTPEEAEAELLAMIQNSHEATNGTIRNTNGGYYRVKVVAVEAWDYASQGDMSDDLIQGQRSAQITARRNELNADFVTIWTGLAKSGTAGNAFPFGLGEAYAYNVVNVGSGARVKPHEVGHVVGMNHQPESFSVLPALEYPFAMGNYKDGHFLEAVSVWMGNLCPNGCPPVPNYGSKDVYVDGFPTGIENERENGRMLGIAFSVVSHYRVGGDETECVVW